MDKNKPNEFVSMNDENETTEKHDQSIPKISRKFKKEGKHPYASKKSKISGFKPIVIAIISAIVIGSFLGIIMLNMFDSLGDDLSADGHNISAINNNTNDDDVNTEKSNVNPVTLDQMDAYVIQGGVFAEKSNVEEWSNKYAQAGFSTIIWERENQYFLLVGIANTMEDAKKITAEFKAHGLDVFAKEWSTSAVDVALTKEENSWLKSFREQWYEALKSVNNQEGILTKKWGNLLENIPKTDKFSNLLAEIKGYHEEMEAVDGRQAQNMLLSIWQQYEDDMN